MALFQLNAPAPAPDGSGPDVLGITVGEAVMHQVDAQGNWYANGGIVAAGVTVAGIVTLQAVDTRMVFAAPGTALLFKDAADGQVKILNDDGMIYTLTATHAPAPEAKPAPPESAR